MKPAQLARSGTEHGHQVALFAWIAIAIRHGFQAADDEWCYASDGPDQEPRAMRKYGTANAVPSLRWAHAIANGGSRGDDDKSRKIRGGALKAEGVRAGVPDVFLPWPTGMWAGLYIEMKKPQGEKSRAGKLSEEQENFRDYARAAGYGWMMCYTWIEAKEVIKQYLTWSDTQCESQRNLTTPHT